MNEVFLYTFPQWIVFAALFVIIYGWVEGKKVFRLTGDGIFILLGIFALVVLLGDHLAAAHYLSPEEVAREELDEVITNEIPIQARLLPAYWSFLFTGLLAIPTLILDWTDKKLARTMMVVTGLLALLGFFVVVAALRAV